MEIRRINTPFRVFSVYVSYDSSSMHHLLLIVRLLKQLCEDYFLLSEKQVFETLNEYIHEFTFPNKICAIESIHDRE